MVEQDFLKTIHIYYNDIKNDKNKDLLYHTTRVNVDVA